MIQKTTAPLGRVVIDTSEMRPAEKKFFEEQRKQLRQIAGNTTVHLAMHNGLPSNSNDKIQILVTNKPSWAERALQKAKNLIGKETDGAGKHLLDFLYLPATKGEYGASRRAPFNDVTALTTAVRNAIAGYHAKLPPIK